MRYISTRRIFKDSLTIKSIFTMLVLGLIVGCSKECPVLTVEGGQIQGVPADISGVYVFRGIPYAAPPIHELRWKAPQPVVPWEGIRLCDKFGRPGFQHTQFRGGYYTEWGYGDESPYSEDCLYLNVWTRRPGCVDANLPVILWIHGGGCREGFGSEPEFDGQEFAAKDVVLVSINYRLGVFGFLAHPELSAESGHNASANYGILDQIQSLKWVRDNIAQFGGNPNNVTIAGQSAGGGCVRILCESPLARGLFHKAVIMSAGGLSPLPEVQPNDRVIDDQNVDDGIERIAAYHAPVPPAGLTEFQRAEFNSKVIMDWAGYTSLEKMRAASTEAIFTVAEIYNSATGNFPIINGMSLVNGYRHPIVDGYASTESFDAAAVDGTLADVPYLIGYTMNDYREMSDEIVNFCINREKNGSKAWAYEFARPLPDDNSHPEARKAHQESTSENSALTVLQGAFHSSDLWYVFKSMKHSWRPWTKGDWELSERMITAWANFARYGDPNGSDEGEWTPCTESNPRMMIFKLDKMDNDVSEMGVHIAELKY